MAGFGPNVQDIIMTDNRRISSGFNFPEPGTVRMVDHKVEEWHTHQAYLGEGPRAGDMVYKRISQARELNVRK